MELHVAVCCHVTNKWIGHRIHAVLMLDIETIQQKTAGFILTAGEHGSAPLVRFRFPYRSWALCPFSVGNWAFLSLAAERLTASKSKQCSCTSSNEMLWLNRGIVARLLKNKKNPWTVRERATKDVAHFASSRRLYIPRLVCSWVAWTKQEPVKIT